MISIIEHTSSGVSMKTKIDWAAGRKMKTHSVIEINHLIELLLS